MENVFRVADDIANIYQTRSNLKAKIEELKQIKNNHYLNKNTNRQQLLPLGLPAQYYEQL